MCARTVLDSNTAGGVRRLFVGLRLRSEGRDLAGALVEIRGRGFDSAATILGVDSRAVSPEAASLFDQLSAETVSPGLATQLAAQLVGVQTDLVNSLLAAAGASPQQVVALGVHDPGVWQVAGRGATCYASLCDAARLAASTGVNVVDAFPARDIAAGGMGGPVTALGEWLLLRHPLRHRILLHLRGTIRLTYFPPANDPRGADRVLSFDVAPGTSLLDRLASELTNGDEPIDRGGKLAVQGQQIPELIEEGLADPYFDRPLPRWHPRGAPPERYLLGAMRLAIQHDWSVRDLLCSATHFIAETTARSVRRHLPKSPPVDEMLVTGGGRHNGLLLRELEARIPELPRLRLSEAGVSHEAIPPASVAILTALAVDQASAGRPNITGAAKPSVLGRFTPGAAENWRRLLADIHASSADRPMRTA